LTANPDELDWELWHNETLVILMGGQQLAEIVHQLLRRAIAPNTCWSFVGQDVLNSSLTAQLEIFSLKHGVSLSQW